MNKFELNPESFQLDFEKQYQSSPDAKALISAIIEKIDLQLNKYPIEERQELIGNKKTIVDNLTQNKQIQTKALCYLEDFERRMENAGFFVQYEEAFDLFSDDSMNGEKFGDVTIDKQTPIYFINFLEDLLIKESIVSDIKNEVRKTDDETKIKDIYYSVYWLILKFRLLQDKYGHSEERRIAELYYMFRQVLWFLRGEIYLQAKAKGIELKPEVGVKDFDSSGKYIDLYETEGKNSTKSTNPKLTSDGGPSAEVTQESNLASKDSKEKIKELADFLITGFMSPEYYDIMKGLLLNGHVAGTERIPFLGKEKELLGIIKSASEYGFLELGNEDIFDIY